MEDPDRWFPPSPPTGVPSVLPPPPPIPSTVNFNYFISNRSFRITVPSVLVIAMLMIFCCIYKKLKAFCNICAANASSSTAALLQDDNDNELAELPSSSRASPPMMPQPLPPPGSGSVTRKTITTHTKVTVVRK